MNMYEFESLERRYNEGAFYYKFIDAFNEFAESANMSNLKLDGKQNIFTTTNLTIIMQFFGQLEDFYDSCNRADYAKNFVNGLGETQKAQVLKLVRDTDKYTYPENERQYIDWIRAWVQSNGDTFAIFREISSNLLELYAIADIQTEHFIYQVANICLSVINGINNKATKCFIDL